jgi:hypothetical protein
VTRIPKGTRITSRPARPIRSRVVQAERAAWLGAQDISWQTNAACQGKDADLFWPESRYAAEQFRKKVRRICDQCPVKRQCAQYARSNRDAREFGTWAGQDQWERADARKRRGAA